MSDTEQNWIISQDDDGIAWLTFDKAGTSTNVLSGHIMRELAERVTELREMRPKALIVRSAKKNGFVAGADIKEFTGLETEEQAFELIRSGQQVLDQLENLPFPSVAVINGFALGGGLELAMACTYRVADADNASLGLPEVKLGIHPGFGGTVRAVRYMGVLNAMNLMLTGRNLRAKAAQAQGLVDAVAPARNLEATARKLALNPPAKPRAPLHLRLLNTGAVRGLIAKQLEKTVAKKARKDHYPAPYAMIDLWRENADSEHEMLLAEARSIAHLMLTPTARNLVRVFLLQDRMKGLARRSKRDFKHVHVVGAGTMGGDIAAWCVLQGMRVTLQDRGHEYVQPAVTRARKLFEKKLKQPRKVQAAMDRLMPDVDGDGVAQADVLIEAIFEDTEAKRALYADVEKRMKPDAVLATNTSSIRLEKLCDALEQPERLVGLHFFNPVPMMPLVEVVRGERTADDVFDTALAFTGRISKIPLPCKSSPGFLVNRVLMPYLVEAVKIAEDGVSLKAIDDAAVRFGMPMGPVELSDTVGLDVAKSVTEILADEYGLSVPEELEKLVQAGKLGRKSGEGFYVWKDGKAVKPAVVGEVPADLEDRLILPMINEAVACLEESVVEDAELLDGGVIFGTGFAPFRGGPMAYARSIGIDELLGRLDAMEQAHGERFHAADGWDAIRKA